MRGNTTLKLTQSAMIEAIQMYMDAQLTNPHTVKAVRKDTNSCTHGVEHFEVDIAAVEPLNTVMAGGAK